MHAIDALLDRSGHVARRRDLLTVATRAEIDHETRTGRLISPFRRTWCRPWDADLPHVRRRAALLSVGAPVALSHLSVLAVRDLRDAAAGEPVHVAVPHHRSLRRQDGLVLHRVGAPDTFERWCGLALTPVADALLASWRLLPAADRRAPIIAAVRRRVVAAPDLLAAVPRHRLGADRPEVQHLVHLLAAGCESELEIWGFSSVFDHPALRHGVRQRWVVVNGERFRLDLAFDAELVAVELDGDRWHSTPEQRERDRRRDARLASHGWLVLRFTYARLTGDPAGCRADLLATLATRQVRRAG